MTTDEPFPPGSTFIGYARDSGGPGQGYSCDQQEYVIRQWAEARGYTIIKIFFDRARSGTTTVGRDGYLQLRGFFESRPKITGAVVWDYQRWSRDYWDGMELLALIKRLGYEFHSIDDDIPPGPAGEMIRAYKMVSAEDFSRKLSRAVKRGQAHAARRGSMPSGRTPAGYIARYEGDRRIIEPDPETAPLVRKAFEMRAMGHTMREIADEVGLYTTYNSYANLFSNQIYIGRLVWGETVYPEFCEPLIDPETWRQVQQINHENRERHPRQVTSSYLLSGLVTCARCGRGMPGTTITSTERKRYKYYRCKGSVRWVDEPCDARQIRMQVLDRLVLARLREVLMQPVHLHQVYEAQRAKADGRAAEYEQERQHQARKLVDVQRQIANTARAIAEGGQLRSLVEMLAELEAQEAELMAEQVIDYSAPPTLPDLDEEGRADYGRDLWAAIEAAEFRDRQLLVRSMVGGVSVVKTDVGITGEITLLLFEGEFVIPLD